MRVDTIFEQAAAAGTQPVSFEMFPNKGELTLDKSREVATGFAALKPDFISVTYSAGGSGNKGATGQISGMINDEFGISSVAHLTCISLRQPELEARISAFKDAGVENVLALRGDVPAGVPKGPGYSDYRYAADIIPPLVEAGFCVGCAGYPEGHIDCESLGKNVHHLRLKQDAGANYIATQLCFDNASIYRFLDIAEAAGITIPITIGIMPFMSKAQVTRMVFMCGASLPSPVIKLVARYGDDPDDLRKAGIDYACQQLQDLQLHGVDGLHIYTMNRQDVAEACMSALGRA